MSKTLKDLFNKFRKRFVVGSEYEHYLPPHKQMKDSSNPNSKWVTIKDVDLSFRDPSPASQPRKSVPAIPEETEYNTAYYKRRDIKQSHFEHLEPGAQPRHIPAPSWLKTREGVKAWRRQYRLSGGLAPFGVVDMNQKDYVDVMTYLDKDVQNNRPYN